MGQWHCHVSNIQRHFSKYDFKTIQLLGANSQELQNIYTWFFQLQPNAEKGPSAI